MTSAFRSALLGAFFLGVGHAVAIPALRAAEDQKAAALASLGISLNGLTVSQVQKDSKAARAGLQAGDIIANIGNTDITTPSAAQTAIRRAMDEGWGAIPFRVMRNGQVQYIVIF
jgi:S1-C subfamily serine protease